MPRLRSRVRAPSSARAIGAAGARFPDTEEVTGSIPVSPTTDFHHRIATPCLPTCRVSAAWWSRSCPVPPDPRTPGTPVAFREWGIDRSASWRCITALKRRLGPVPPAALPHRPLRRLLPCLAAHRLPRWRGGCVFPGCTAHVRQAQYSYENRSPSLGAGVAIEVRETHETLAGRQPRLPEIKMQRQLH